MSDPTRGLSGGMARGGIGGAIVRPPIRFDYVNAREEAWAAIANGLTVPAHLLRCEGSSCASSRAALATFEQMYMIRPDYDEAPDEEAEIAATNNRRAIHYAEQAKREGEP